MSKLNGFLDNVGTASGDIIETVAGEGQNFVQGLLNPGGSLRDFQHAARLYIDNAFRLAPKVKFLYFVNFTLSDEALRFAPTLGGKHRGVLNMLVKSVDLPQYTATVETRNQYNRKKNTQSSIQYTDVAIKMHDDNAGVTTQLLEAYYRYYFQDPNVDTTASFNPRGTYSENRTVVPPEPLGSTTTTRERAFPRYGLDNETATPFFKEIKLYQFTRQSYMEYTLVNPIVAQWGHDTMDQADSSGIAENSLILKYESVLYNAGRVSEDDPAFFADTHYDKTLSPLSVLGGGVANVFGGGGILDGASTTLENIGQGTFAGAGIAGIAAANTIRNLDALSADNLRAEGLNIVRSVSSPSNGGLAGVFVPKNNGNSGDDNTTTTVQGLG